MHPDTGGWSEFINRIDNTVPATEYLPAGFGSLLGTKLVVENAKEDSAALTKLLSKYIDNKSEFWPIVSYVRLEGPFEFLCQNGLRILDIPGTKGDPRPSIQQISQRGLKACDRVFYFPNSFNSASKDVVNFYLSPSQTFADQAIVLTRFKDRFEDWRCARF